jgi:CheY-like chemotaxis protein
MPPLSQTMDAANQASPPSVQQQHTILLVEDDRSVRRLLEAALKRSGYSVVPAEDGLQAMKLAMSEKIDAVVTDAIMPNLGGYELSRFLRRHPKLSQVPIILLSGLEQNEADQSNAQINAHMVKPVKPEELKNCIERLLAEKA